MLRSRFWLSGSFEEECEFSPSGCVNGTCSTLIGHLKLRHALPDSPHGSVLVACGSGLTAPRGCVSDDGPAGDARGRDDVLYDESTPGQGVYSTPLRRRRQESKRCGSWDGIRFFVRPNGASRRPARPGRVPRRSRRRSPRRGRGRPRPSPRSFRRRRRTVPGPRWRRW